MLAGGFVGGCASSSELPSGASATAGGSSTGDDGPSLTVGSLVTGLESVGQSSDSDSTASPDSDDDSATDAGGSTDGGSSETSTTDEGGSSGSTGGETLPEYCDDTVPVAGLDPLIDDLELEAGQVFPDEEIPMVDGRVGFWFTFNDGTLDGMQTPTPGGFQPSGEGADGTAYSARTFGSGFGEWGAGLAVSLNNNFDGNCPYDGSTYDGLSFWARGTGTVRFMVVTRATAPEPMGGSCDPMAMQCDDHHGVSITLSPEWTLHQVAWSDLAQQGWGAPADFDAADLTELQWQSPEDQPFDFSIDELSFLTMG